MKRYQVSYDIFYARFDTQNLQEDNKQRHGKFKITISN